MNTYRYNIGFGTVFMLVVLRLALGWHFLYEGLWKITHRDQFVAETQGFLSAARGPASVFFYGMVPDIDGHQRLESDLKTIDFDDENRQTITAPRLAKSWDELRQKAVAFYRPVSGKDEDIKLHKQFEAEAKRVYQRHVHGLEEFIKENGDLIAAHFASLQRFGDQGKTDPSTDFMRQRRWDQMQELRKEAKGWIADLDSREKALKADLVDIVNKQRLSEVVVVVAEDAKPKGKADKEAKKAASEPTDAKSKPPADAKEADGKEKEIKAPAAANTKPADAAKSGDAKSTDAKKPADAPKSAEPPADDPKKSAGDKSKPKEATESGNEESSEAEDAKITTVKVDEKATDKVADKASDKSKEEPKKPDATPAKPQAAEKEKGVAKAKDKAAGKTDDQPIQAAATVMLVDFSPLAVGHDPAGPFVASPNPMKWTRTEQMAGLLSYTLFAIGLCLMLGLFTRLAALGGACFLLFVIFSQPSYPGMYPLDPPQLGHSLLVNKDFVEMTSLLLIASTRLSRWTGLDFFLHNCLIKPFCGRDSD